jgi:AGZA family xanthine/uracil permease-like MFS transporter
MTKSAAAAADRDFVARYFRFAEEGTNYRREIIVGVLMVSSLGEIKWTQLEIAVPAFLTLVCMPLTYSIANGIALGLVAYPVTMLAAGRRRELHPMMLVLFVVCMLYFAYLA